MIVYLPYENICCFLSLFVFLIANSETKHYFHSIGGPFRVDVKRAEVCKKTSYEGNFSIFLRDARTKYTQDLAYTGNMTVPFYLDDTLGARMALASWSNVAGWKENAFILNFNDGLCRVVLNNVAGQTWYNFGKSIFNEIVHCPLYPGIYRFENLVVDLSKLPAKHFVYGRWRMEAKFLKGSQPQACLTFLMDTVPV